MLLQGLAAFESKVLRKVLGVGGGGIRVNENWRKRFD